MSYQLLIVVVSVIGPILGSLIGVLKKPSDKFLYNMLSFAGGVMLAVSFLELIPESIKFSSASIAAIGFVVGAVIMFLIDKIIPHVHPGLCEVEHGQKIKRTAYYLLFGIFIHNFPEGMAIGIGAVSDIKVSLLIASAIALQNIPEGVATSAPYYYYTKKRLRAFLVSSSTAIPVLIGYLFASTLYQYISLTFVGFVVALTAGLMVYITADELIPASCCKVSDHKTILSLILGVLFVILLGI